MGIIWSFSVCFIFILVFKLYIITTLRSKSPRSKHFLRFNWSMAIWASINPFLFVSKPITLTTNQNFTEIVAIAKVKLSLVCIVSVRLRICINAATLVDFLINCYKAPWGVLADGNGNVSFGSVFHHTGILFPIRRFLFHEKSNNIFGERVRWDKAF